MQRSLSPSGIGCPCLWHRSHVGGKGAVRLRRRKTLRLGVKWRGSNSSVVAEHFSPKQATLFAQRNIAPMVRDEVPADIFELELERSTSLPTATMVTISHHGLV